MCVLAVLVGAAPSIARAGPSQLDRAKAVFAEGKALLDAKNYVDATAKFEEAYRLAPDKHLFNFNIASAAELAGDCRKAQRHHRMFLDLVADHPLRKDSSRTLAALETSCAAEEAAAVPVEDRGEREAERKHAVAQRALGDALQATQQSVLRYDAVLTKHGRQQPFAQVVRARRRDAKKIAKLFAVVDLPVVEAYNGEVGAPATVEQACRQAETQEARNIATYEKVYDLFDHADVVKLMDKLLQRAEGRHLRAFRDTCPR